MSALMTLALVTLAVVLGAVTTELFGRGYCSAAMGARELTRSRT